MYLKEKQIIFLPCPSHHQQMREKRENELRLHIHESGRASERRTVTDPCVNKNQKSIWVQLGTFYGRSGLEIEVPIILSPLEQKKTKDKS